MSTSDTRDTSAKDEGLLMSVAESIGSTLGSLAAKANAATQAFSKSTKPKKNSSRKRKVARSSRATPKKSARSSAKRRTKRTKPAKKTRTRSRK